MIEIFTRGGGDGMSNRFEKKVLDAAVAAQEFHLAMTGGNQYLWESHESFLQSYIAFRFAKFDTEGRFDEENGYCVYFDASPKKIRQGLENAYPGKTPMKRSRFDLVIWSRKRDEVKAILEVKRAWMKTPIEDDIKKVTEFLSKRIAESAAGYVLYYTDCKKYDGVQIKNRFCRIDGFRDSKMVGCRIKGVSGEHSWGFALYRCQNPQ